MKHVEYRKIKPLSIWDHGTDPSEPLVIRKAKALRLLLEETAPIIMDDELIVGLRTLYGEIKEGENVTPGLASSSRRARGLLLPVKSLTNHNRSFYPKYLTDEEAEAAVKEGTSEGAYTSHVPFGFAKVLKKGISGIKKQVAKRVEDVESETQIEFLQAVIICMDALSDFIKKHSAEAIRIADSTSDLERRAELIRISEICSRISTGPPKSFYGAVQLFWFYTIVMAAESQSCIPIGRLDYDLWPFLRADLDSGVISFDAAQTLVESLWIKLNFETDITADTCRNVTLSGTNSDGVDSTNELTYMFMDASKKLRLADPKLNIRFHEDSPKRLWKKAVELVKAGLGGFPVFYCDETIIEGLRKMDVPLEDARLYSCDGCQEIIIPGKGDFYPVHTAVNLLECVQRTLGVEPMLVNVGGPDIEIPETIKHQTFEEFMAQFNENLDILINSSIWEGNRRDAALAKYSPVPFLSSTLEGCIENAKDKTWGGCTYNWTGCNGNAFVSAVNSLAAIKKMVYDEKLVSLSELRYQLKEDWSNERLRQYALNRVPKWGNDDDYVDTIAIKVAEHFMQEVKKHSNPRGGPYYPGIFTFFHVSKGIRTSASPDGRHAGDTISPHVTPQAGTDKSGPTSAVDSALKVMNLKLPEGTVLDLRFHPTVLMGDDGLQKLVFFIKAFMSRGGSIIQFNVIDSKTLLKAQAKPEQYQTLIVRVWGFSAYFTTLIKEYQDEIIARIEHGLN
jgi:formate C-acetyltransferase